MSKQLLDFKASVPANQFGSITPIPLPITPGVLLADLGIFIVPPVPQPNRVDLKGTIGLNSITAASPTVTIRIFRLNDNTGPGVEIFNKRLTVEGSANTELIYTASFSTIDFNVAPTSGFVVYQLFAESSAVGTVTVVGPVTFTGLAVAL
ncbi:hypothetical protein Q5741_03020 [Paenibacillus sp. JX-17]|uniref:Exosporium protein C n=1 Tax=Paenibacillus lacisoli TaxID=3064525 RepID=A0ABT9CCF6_9BACL|nr:hypothetical protein [Paenibacillus sp. JX-17]MDO7905381.1 hypothetical protein [Paenibacillus sp. JX-17]